MSSKQILLFGSRFKRKIYLSLALVLVLSALSYGSTGKVGAANLTSVSDTLSTSAPTVLATHVVKFTTPTGITTGKTVAITFTSFTNVAAVVFGDVSMTVNGVATTTAASASASSWGVSAAGTTVTLTAPSSGTPAAAGATLQITITNRITNPAAGSYKISIAGTMTDSADTMVAIVSTVQITAAVDTTFTFAVSGVSSGASVNGDSTTSTTTTATQIAFGYLTPGTPKMGVQQLAVTTNASNGFSVTVQENQLLTSSNGATISHFANGSSVSTPTAWSSPSGTLGNTATYGHYGVTSESTENAGEFSGDKFAGNLSTPRVVFATSTPADGTTPNTGTTKVGFKIEITALQAAAKDYSNNITYVATPNF